NAFKWILVPFNREDSKITIDFSYNNKRLKEQIDELSCFDPNKVVEPKNPSFEYKDNGYIIIDEVIGNKVDKDTLYSRVVNALDHRKTEIDLEAEGIYIDPQYHSTSKEIVQAKDQL